MAMRDDGDGLFFVRLGVVPHPVTSGYITSNLTPLPTERQHRLKNIKKKPIIPLTHTHAIRKSVRTAAAHTPT